MDIAAPVVKPLITGRKEKEGRWGGRGERKREGGRECKRESEGGGRGAMTIEGDAAQGRILT